MTTLETLTPTVIAAPGVVESGARAPSQERRRRPRLAHGRASIGDEGHPQQMPLQCQSRVFSAAERQQARWSLANALTARDTYRVAAPTLH